jgi:hypothetical protein
MIMIVDVLLLGNYIEAIAHRIEMQLWIVDPSYSTQQAVRNDYKRELDKHKIQPIRIN